MSHEEDLAKVKKDDRALQSIKEQTLEICLAAVQNYGSALQFVKEQTPSICLAAVQQDGWALQHIKKQTPNKLNLNNLEHKTFYDLGWRNGDLARICLAAVKQNVSVFKIIKDPDCLAFVQDYVNLHKVKEYGYHLSNVKNKTPEICMAAVQKDPWALQFIDEDILNEPGWTPSILNEIFEVAVKKDGRSLRFIKNQTHALSLLAVKEIGISLEHVKEQTPQICLEAVNNSIWAIRYIKDFESVAMDIHLEEAQINHLLYSSISENVKAINTIIKIQEAHKIANKVNDAVNLITDFKPAIGNKKIKI